MKFLIILFLLFTSILFGQQKELRGTVVNENGEPLNLANITIKGTQIGTSTEKNGKFNLLAEFDEGDIILVSFIGYQTLSKSVDDLNFVGENLFTLKEKILTSQTVLVEGSIAKEGITPVSYSKIDRKEIDENYIQQDIPEYLSYLPSTTFFSEGGSGLGYNYLSIRGFDQRRISISVNGIPQNDPEDNNVYWIDMPDLLAGTELIQVQRGAGSGVIGYPAIGGSINIITSTFSNTKLFELGADYGSYNTSKYSAAFSSGLISNKYSIYVKLSKTNSSGYRDLSWVDLTSYYVSAVRYDENITTQLNIYGGLIADGLVYTGLPKFTIKDREERRKNYSYWEAADGEYLYTVQRKPTEIENFSQPHFELLNEFRTSENTKFNSALFLIIGNGFFDYDGSWSIYYDDYFRLKENGFDSTTQPTNALIRANVGNTQWGWIPRFSWKHNGGELILGGEFRFHRSDHWGKINFADTIPEDVPADYKYYSYNGLKDIISIYANEQYRISDRVNLLVELQLAYHRYRLYNEAYVGTDFTLKETYFNPRIGFNYRFTPDLNSYISLAQVTREPRLKTYYDAAESSAGATPQFEVDKYGNYDFSQPLVLPETMNDIEVGANLNKRNYSLSVNLFYMLFTNEIVKKGQVDRFGQPVTGNMDRTIHTGIEFSGTFRFSNHFDFTLNATYSNNYISDGKHYIDDQNYLDLSGNNISGFPDWTVNGIIKFYSGGFFTQLWLKYVGDIYTDNYGNNLQNYLSDYPGFVDYNDNVVEAYFVSNLLISYELNAMAVLNKLKIFLQINNIFDNLYAAYGIGKEFFPAAERRFTAGIKIGL